MDGKHFLHPPFIGPYETGPGTGIPEIVCISLTTRPDRRERMEALLEGYPLHMHDVAPQPERAADASRESHLQLIERARELGHPSVLIVENDLKVVRNLAALPPFPDDWQIAYLGGLCTQVYEWPEPPSIWVRSDVYCAHAYVVKAELYEEILERGWRADGDAMDTFLVKQIHPHRRVYTPIDSYIVQRADWSDVQGTRCWTGFMWPRAGQPFTVPTPRPTICLNMIVKDEAHVVLEALESVVAYLDYWVIVDTGSTDGTCDVIWSYFRDKEIPGELHRRPWKDFGRNRSEALALAAGKADYTWVLDADDRVMGTLDLTGLREDSYDLRYGEGFTYWRKQIFRSARSWRYEGVVHEYPVCGDGEASGARLDGAYWIDSRRLGSRNLDAQKYIRDAALLEAHLTEHPDDARAMFYLAQSHYDGGDQLKSLVAYTRRSEMGGWDEEVYYARLRRAMCLERLGVPWEQALDAYLAAWDFRPSRIEPLFEIARHYRVDRQWALGHLFAKQAASIPLPDDTLFVSADMHCWRAKDEQAICAHYLGYHRESVELCIELLDGPHLPETERARVTANRDFSLEQIKDETLSYPAAVVARLVERVHSGEPSDITLAITTCRRPDLFEKTINSFLNCCVDADRIGRWILIDDGSSEADRAQMQDRYPFFEFVLKDRADKGHPESMNMLRELVDTPYWLHLEDDWQFVVRERYVAKALAILEDDPAITQVLFNRHYAETFGCRALVGGALRKTARDGIRYLQHVHHEYGSEAFNAFFRAFPPDSKGSAHWPHYSLRPSLSRTDALKRVGRYDPEADDFELEFAHRFNALGLKSAFFDDITSLHIGKFTWEQGTNAYSLNRAL